MGNVSTLFMEYFLTPTYTIIVLALVNPLILPKGASFNAAEPRQLRQNDPLKLCSVIFLNDEKTFLFLYTFHLLELCPGCLSPEVTICSCFLVSSAKCFPLLEREYFRNNTGNPYIIYVFTIASLN